MVITRENLVIITQKNTIKKSKHTDTRRHQNIQKRQEGGEDSKKNSVSSLGKWVASGVFTGLGMQEMKKKKKCRRRKRF